MDSHSEQDASAQQHCRDICSWSIRRCQYALCHHCVYSIDLVHVVELWHVSSNETNPSMISESRIGRPEAGLVGRHVMGTCKSTFKFGIRPRLMAEVASLGHLAQAQEQHKGTAKSMCGAETTQEKQRSCASQKKLEVFPILSITLSHTTRLP